MLIKFHKSKDVPDISIRYVPSNLKRLNAYGVAYHKCSYESCHHLMQCAYLPQAACDDEPSASSAAGRLRSAAD